MCAIHFDTTLEILENQIVEINSSIDNAVANARVHRETAQREDARLKALADTLTQRLQSAVAG